MEREDIYLHLRKQIIEFTLLPGDLLSENTLAAELNVSRSPIRDALAQLVEEGWVVVYPQKGTQVSFISVQRMRNYAFVRNVWDTAVFNALCKAGLSQPQFAQLEDSLAKQRQYYEKQLADKLLLEDVAMHRLFYTFSGHEASWQNLARLDSDMLRISYLQIKTYGHRVSMSAVDSWENTIVEHRILIDALRRRDTEAVCITNSRHIEQALWSSEYLRRIYPTYFEG